MESVIFDQNVKLCTVAAGEEKVYLLVVEEKGYLLCNNNQFLFQVALFCQNSFLVQVFL